MLEAVAEGKFGTYFVNSFLSVENMKKKCSSDINSSVKKQAGNVACFLCRPLDMCFQIIFLFLKK